MQLLIGTSISLWRPPIGTTGFALLLVRGNNWVPTPPPNMIAAKLFGSACCFSKTSPSNIKFPWSTSDVRITWLIILVFLSFLKLFHCWLLKLLLHKLAPILSLKLLQVPIEMRILVLNNLGHDAQLSSNPHLIKPEVMPSFLHITYKAPEGIMVLLHHRNYRGE